MRYEVFPRTLSAKLWSFNETGSTAKASSKTRLLSEEGREGAFLVEQSKNRACGSSAPTQ